MGLFYKVSDKDLLNIRNKIFQTKGVSALEKNGFIKSPFIDLWYGRNNLGDFCYTFSRLRNGLLEMIYVYIARGDSWIKIKLNIFELAPNVTSLEELNNKKGIKYFLNPLINKSMRLRADDYKFIPIVSSFYKNHKLGSYNSKRGLRRKVRQLEQLIENDMTNIDSFVARWHELHTPAKVDWEGNKIE